MTMICLTSQPLTDETTRSQLTPNHHTTPHCPSHSTAQCDQQATVNNTWPHSPFTVFNNRPTTVTCLWHSATVKKLLPNSNFLKTWCMICQGKVLWIHSAILTQYQHVTHRHRPAANTGASITASRG